MNIFKYKLYTKGKLAILLFHLAFIVIILGAGITRYTSSSGVMRIREGNSSNIIISDSNYLFATITDGKETKNIRKKISFSPIKDNNFSLNTKFKNKSIQISYNEFVPDATPEVVQDKKKGKPLLKVVVSIGQGRKTIFLKKGEIEKIGHSKTYYKLGFYSSDKKIINIVEKKGNFYINSPIDLDFFIMSSQNAGKIKKDTLNPLKLKTLYRTGDFSFIPIEYHEKGIFKLVTTAKKPKDNDKNKDDALIVNVSVGGKERKSKFII